MTVGEMINNVEAECHPITDIRPVMLRWADRGQKVIASKKEWFWLRKHRVSLQMQTGVAEYTLSPLVDLSKLLTMYDAVGSQRLAEMSEEEFRYVEPGARLHGPPSLYRIVGFSPQHEPIIVLYPIPDGTRTLFYDFTMKLPALTQESDVSLIPEKYHDVIEFFMKHRTYVHLNNPTMASLVRQEFQERIEDMKRDDHRPRGVWSFDAFTTMDVLGEPRLPGHFPRGA